LDQVNNSETRSVNPGNQNKEPDKLSLRPKVINVVAQSSKIGGKKENQAKGILMELSGCSRAGVRTMRRATTQRRGSGRQPLTLIILM
jgi:hypothetical protein